MTQETIVRCSNCNMQFGVEFPDSWTEEDLAAHISIFSQDNSKSCRLHPRSLGETLPLPLNELLLRGELEDPGDPGEDESKRRPRGGRRGYGKERTGELTPALLRVLKLWSPDAKGGGLAHTLNITHDTLTTNLARIRETLGAASNQEAQQIAREKGWLE